MEVCDGLLTQLIGPQNDKKAAEYEISQMRSDHITSLPATPKVRGVIVPARARAVSDSVIDISGREQYLVPLPGL